MALKAVPIKPVEAHALDDPRRPPSETREPTTTEVHEPASQPLPPAQSPPRRRRSRDVSRNGQDSHAAAVAATLTVPHAQPSSHTELPTNPYAREGRPHQVALSLYPPQWQTIEQQCAELRAGGVPDATVTRWLFALLHFGAPRQPDSAADLIRRLARLEADDDGPYFGLRKEARGIRVFSSLWDSQRSIVTELRRDTGPQRPTLATWTAAVVEFQGPKTSAEARALLRQLRLLLAGDPSPNTTATRFPSDP